LYTARIILRTALDDAQALAASAFFGDKVYSCNIFRETEALDASWIIEWVSETPPDFSIIKDGLRELGLETAGDFETAQISKDTDWLQLCYRQFPPFTVGPFFIYGSHYKESVPDGLTGLQIDAATAFGSGEHGTTKTCLEAMLDLNAQGVCPWNVLDMGAGSGILGIAAWKLWKTPVLCVDNDAEAVRVAGHHRDINKVPSGAGGLACETGDGFKTASVQKRKPYDLIIANILAAPLIAFAGELAAVCDENALVILSGMLHSQAEEVLAAYEEHGFENRKKYTSGEWTTLVLRR
jgi:ribosomal protein L11 methyltransferase